MKVTKEIAQNILIGRAVLQLGVLKNVQVTNVSFADAEGQPFQDDNWDNGKPYAIANFNACNAYGIARAKHLFMNGEYDEACNTNLSARVSLEQGRALKEAMYASIVGEYADVDERDLETGEIIEDGKTVKAILIRKAVANEAVSASEAKADWSDVFTKVDENVEELEGAPTIK